MFFWNSLAFSSLALWQVLCEMPCMGVSGWCIDLDYCDIEWFALATTKIILLFLRLQPRTAFWTVLLSVRATPFLLRDSCP